MSPHPGWRSLQRKEKKRKEKKRKEKATHFLYFRAGLPVLLGLKPLVALDSSFYP
jgi:hypothetical protein